MIPTPHLGLGVLGGLAAFSVCAALVTGCGSRTGLFSTVGADSGSFPGDSGVGSYPDAIADSASEPIEPFDVNPGGGQVCARDTPAGTVIWKTTLVTDRYLVGPMAADPSGATYYVDDGFLFGGVVDGGSTIMSLDPCGNPRWRTPWNHFYNDSVTTHLMVSGSRLIAVNGDVRAFDLSTGDELWTADLVTWAREQGLGDVSGSDSIMAPVVTADGTVYLTAYTASQTWLLSIDMTGAPSLVAPVPDTADGGFATDLIVDNVGNLDVPVVFTHVSPGPGEIVSFAHDGGVQWEAQLPQLGYQDHLMSGATSLLNEDTAGLFGFGGTIVGQLQAQFSKPAVVDSQGDFFAISAASSAAITAGSWAPDGTPRWSTNITSGGFYGYNGGPLLGDGSHVFYLSQLYDGTTETASVESLEQASGALVTWTFADRSPGYMLLTPAGELVFTMGTYAIALSSGGELPADTVWPAPRGGVDQRGVARGQ